MDTGADSSNEKAISVSALTGIVKDVVENSALLTDVWVRGEVSNLTRHSSGHIYFSLKDSNAQIKAVMFRRYATPAALKVEAGSEVIAHGSISVYEKRGEYQLSVNYMKLAGVGALFEEFEKLKNKLAAEGLFDPARKKPIPRFPSRIAVVTSPTGAAVRDVINVISRRYPAVQITVSPAIVQGAEAPESVRNALRKAKQLPGVDTILLVRGGGSIEDLWGFNDEALARDIAACEIPIISGVGHETDFTIADFVSDLRAPTPSAAAEMAVPSLRELRAWVEDAEDGLVSTMRDMMKLYNAKLATAATVFSKRRILEILDRRRQALDDFCYASARSIRHRLESRRGGLEHIEKRLQSLDPRRVMSRGFSVCTVAGGDKVVTSTAQAPDGTWLEIHLSDGSVPAKVDRRRNLKQKTLEFE